MGYLRVSVLSLVAFLLLFWFSGPAGVVLLPLLTALLIYVLGQDFLMDQFFAFDQGEPRARAQESKGKKAKGRKSSNHRALSASIGRTAQARFSLTMSWLGALIGFLGSLIAVTALMPADFVSYAQRMPANVNVDITSSLYKTLYALTLSNQANNFGGPAFILLTTALTAGFSLGLGFVARNYRQYVSWALVGLTCLILVTTVFQATGEFRQAISGEPPNLGYAYDGVIYLKTFYRMADKDFYVGYVEAAANDSRVNKEKAVRNGKFYGYVGSPFYFRTPIVFYFWRIFAFGSAVGILYLGIISALGVIVLSYLAGKRLVGESGVFMSVALVPYLIVGLIWYNLFFPDWWAALALTAGIFFWIREQYRPAAALFLVAAAFREVVFVFLLVFLVSAFVYKKAARLPFGAAAVLFLLVYPVHFFYAKRFIALQGQEVSGIVSRLLPKNLIPASSYQMFPYGYFLWPAFLLVAVAAIAWALKRRYDLFALCVMAVPYFAYASSSYWGQHLLPVIVFSAFMVFLLREEDITLTGPKKAD